MSMSNSSNEITTAVAKAGPAIAGASYAVSGLQWAEIAAILTCIYVLIQIVLLLPKLRHQIQDWVIRFKAWRSK